jgi:hypothetical protein
LMLVNVVKKCINNLLFFHIICVLTNEGSFLALLRTDCYKIHNYDYSDLLITYDKKRE